MAIINKTGIGEGNLIDAEHVTRIIDSLDGTGAYSVAATGSFTGSFIGDGSQLTGIVATNAVSSSYAATASYLEGTISSASYSDTAVSASYALSASYSDRTISASFATTASRSVTSATASYIQGSNLNQSLNVSGGFSVNSAYGIFQTLYTTTTNASSTNIYTWPAFIIGTGVTIEASVVGVSGSVTETGTVGGNFIGVYSQNDGVIGQTSSSFSSGFTAAGEPTYGIVYSGAPGNKFLRFYVKGLTNETIDWTVSIRTLS